MFTHDIYELTPKHIRRRERRLRAYYDRTKPEAQKVAEEEVKKEQETIAVVKQQAHQQSLMRRISGFPLRFVRRLFS